MLSLIFLLSGPLPKAKPKAVAIAYGRWRPTAIQDGSVILIKAILVDQLAMMGTLQAASLNACCPSFPCHCMAEGKYSWPITSKWEAIATKETKYW